MSRGGGGGGGGEGGGGDNCFYIAAIQTSETQIRSKVMPPPNTNPMELDDVRIHVSNPFRRLSILYLLP